MATKKNTKKADNKNTKNIKNKVAKKSTKKTSKKTKKVQSKKVKAVKEWTVFQVRLPNGEVKHKRFSKGTEIKKVVVAQLDKKTNKWGIIQWTASEKTAERTIKRNHDWYVDKKGEAFKEFRYHMVRVLDAKPSKADGNNIKDKREDRSWAADIRAKAAANATAFVLALPFLSQLWNTPSF